MLLADVAGVRRTLAFDSDVRELFRKPGETPSVAVEVRELFPEAGAQPFFVHVPVIAPSPPSGGPRSSRGKTPASGGVCKDPVARARPLSAPPKGATVKRPAFFPAPVTSQLPQRPCLAGAEFRRPLPTRPSVGRGPSGGSNGGQAKFDSRPGRWLDSEWAAMTATAGKTGTVSCHMLEAFGLRDEYERMQVTSERTRAALQKLLEVRDSVPGEALFLGRSFARASSHISAKTSVGEASVSSDAEKRARMDPSDWEEGEFSPVTGRDAKKLWEVVESLQSIEDDAATRLRDEKVSVTWYLANARKRFTDERRLAHGRSQLTPKKVLVESPWLEFGNLGSLVFRVYPRGDAMCLDGGTTVFLWMARAPGVSFSFNLLLGRAEREEREAESIGGAFFATAPRIWQADMVHYRMDICWSEVAAVLTDMAAEDSLDFTINVLQWHIIRPPEVTLRPGEASSNHMASS